MNGYEYIADTIKGYDVSHIFYVEAMLRMAVRELGELGVKRVMAHTENAAAYMADGYARMSGKPGVCLAQSIGAANLAGGIHEAWLAKTPVIAMTGKKPPVYQYRGCYQEADHRLLYEGITKFNSDVSQSEQLPVVLRQCFREAVTGKPGPVHVDLSNHTGRVIEMGTVSQGGAAVEEDFKKYPAFRPEAEQERVQKALKEISCSQRPVIVIGRGAAVSGAGKEIYQLAELLDIPVVTTPDGKGLVDEFDPLWSGIVGAYGMDCANRTVLVADLVIFTGTQAGDQSTLDWKVPASGTRIIQVDIDPAELGRNYANCLGLPGDAKAVVRQMLQWAEKNEVRQKRSQWRQEVSGYVRETLEEFEGFRTSGDLPMRPERLCREIEDALPEDAVVVADTGYSAVFSALMIRMKPTQSYFRAAGSLGWSYPASLGVKCAAGDRPVICFTGDGAFYYHLNEMETAVRNGINTVTVINNNRALAQCTPDLRLVYKGQEEKMPRRYCYPDVDFVSIAEAYGCFAKLVEIPQDIGPTIKEALASGKPAVIDVRTDREIMVPDPLKPR